MNGWIGVDFDGTLAQYGTWVSPTHCGEPIAPMVERVKAWRAAGRQVRIFTARVFPLTQVLADGDLATLRAGLEGMNLAGERVSDALAAAEAIQHWSRRHLGEVLPITCVKDYGMIELYDDRAVQVRPNTGELVGTSTRGLANGKDGEALYNIHKEELDKLGCYVDDFGRLWPQVQTAWHCLANRLGVM